MSTIADMIDPAVLAALLGEPTSPTTWDPAVVAGIVQPDLDALAPAKVFRKPQIAKHQPRLSVPAAELKAAHAKQMVKDNAFSLSALTDAELGRIVRSGLLSVIVDAEPAATVSVSAARTVVAERDAELLVAEQVQRAAVGVLPGFTVSKVEVPELDTTAVQLDVVVPGKARSPYNKARYRAGLTLLDADTTWATVIAEHQRLSGTTTVEIEAVPVADVVDNPKVTALAAVLGISAADATARIAQMENK